MGCLSAPVRLRRDTKIPQITESNLNEYTLCSVAVFDSHVAIPFLSTIPGREAPQVGRWHTFRKGDDAKLQDHQLPPAGVDWESVWAQRETHQALPEELRHLRTEDVGMVLYMCDRAPEGLNNALNSFTYASKFGIVAHSTPFLTGRPHTLFYHQKILSSGAVGLCIRPNANSVTFCLPNLQPVTLALKISDSEGNLVHSIDESNPSRLLLNAIAQLDSTAKDDTYYLGVYTAGLLESPDRLYTIMSGDPSRGTLALEGDTAPVAGTQVRIFRKRSESKSKLAPQKGLNLVNTCSDGIEIVSKAMTSCGGVLELDDTFLVLSENGLITSRFDGSTSHGGKPWKSTLPGSTCNIR
ncbi:hypothetical protein BC835DRAFT_1411196 [Cytidiella melzeri]|nr:hypothetical protein BC835DRAFT_1411196 [Cytidiella melzeri]